VWEFFYVKKIINKLFFSIENSSKSHCRLKGQSWNKFSLPNDDNERRRKKNFPQFEIKINLVLKESCGMKKTLSNKKYFWISFHLSFVTSFRPWIQNHNLGKTMEIFFLKICKKWFNWSVFLIVVFPYTTDVEISKRHIYKLNDFFPLKSNLVCSNWSNM